MKRLKILYATKIQKRALKEIVPWVLEHLCGKRLKNNIELTVKFKQMRKKERLEGTTTWEDDNHKPREFLIEIDKEMPLETIIITLCHELVHVKQMAKGEMKDLFRGPHDMLWRGTRLNTRKMKTPYWDWPWEIEAFGREEGLYIMWKEAKGLKPHDKFQKFLLSRGESV
jgi:prolyl oligopeptidase PreP (S9A serine peptidase family)